MKNGSTTERREKKLSVQRLALSALLLALVYGGTCLNLPLAIGNVNLGDGFLLLGAFLLGSWPAMVAAGIGAALADLTFGYFLYAPATLLIKAGMVAVFLLVRKIPGLRSHPIPSAILAALAAELTMTAGYYLFETFVFYNSNFAAALVGVPFNLLQGAFALAIFLIGAGVLKQVWVWKA